MSLGHEVFVLPCAQRPASDAAVPLLLTARPGGVRLAAFLRQLAAGDDSPAAERWAALRCLPHSCDKPEQATCSGSFLLSFRNRRPLRHPAFDGTSPAGHHRAQCENRVCLCKQVLAACDALLARTAAALSGADGSASERCSHVFLHSQVGMDPLHAL